MKFDHKKDISPKYLLLALSILCLGLLVISAFWGDSVKPLKEKAINLITPLQEGVNNIGEWVNDKFQVFGDVKQLKEKNSELQDQIDSYEAEITKYQIELTELQELRNLYDLNELYPEYNMTAARVFSTNSSNWFNEFYINKGLNQGIYEGCNVLYGNGLLGIVVEAYDDYSRVRAIIDDRSNVTAEITPDGATGIIEGSLTNIEDGYLLMTDINKDADIEAGDKVVTANISDRYFYGITIGYITEITNDQNNLTKTAKITLAVDFSDIKDVLVITDRKQEVNY